MKSASMFCKIFLIFCLPFSVSAEAGFDLEQLKGLFNKYQRKQAYEYASQYLAEQEGDPYFDYFYGVSAIDAGFSSQGVFALERVLLNFPDDHVARLELARGYFILEEYSRSRQEFEAVLATEPPDSVKRTAYLYLDRIRIQEARYHTTVSGFVELGAGYDSNVNSAPDDNFNGQLTPASMEQDDAFYNLTGSARLAVPFSPGWKFNLSGVGIIKKNNELSAFDTVTGTVQTGLSLQDQASEYILDLVAQEFLLDGDSYRSLLGANAYWKYTISEKSRFNTSVQYAQLKYDNYSSLDSDLMTLRLDYSHEFTARMAPVFVANVKLGDEEAKSSAASAQSNTSRGIYALRLGVALSLSPEFVLQTAVGTQQSKYKEAQVIAPLIKREDSYDSVELNLFWLLNKDWRVDTRVSYVKNSSNIELREYDRLLGSINLNYSY